MSEKKSNSDKSKEDIVQSDFVKNLLANQREELELQKQQQALHEKKLDYSHEYALKLLDAQKEDIAAERKQTDRFIFKIMWLIIIVAILISVFVGYCLVYDKEDFLTQILEPLFYILFGGGGGYIYGLNKGKKSAKSGGDFEVAEEV